MTLKTILFYIAAGAAISVAETAPDLPLVGWATQNGGTTGGMGKPTVTVDNVDDLRKYAEAGNATIHVKPGIYTVASKNAIDVGSNVTIYGYRGATLKQTYTGTTNEDNTVLNIKGDNVIIRNLIVQGAGAVDKDAGDCMHVQGGTRVWIDHVEVFDGEDGNLDVINGANYVTISWCKFHYTSASSDHQFSNLIGNSDKKTSDQGKLKTTFHHNWWANGSKERMPRVRFGQVHVANNLFDSKDASHCVRAAYKADLRVEGNIFIGVKKPIDLYNGDYTAVYSNGNYTENTNGNSESGANSSAFTPSYKLTITDVRTQEKAYALRDSIQRYAGANLPDPNASEIGLPASSSSNPSSSSVWKSSSSFSAASSDAKESSSSANSLQAILTKHGAGSSTQSVYQGAEITSFYYTVENATGASAAGLPDGISGVLDGNRFVISGTVSPTAAAKTYPFTITTTGAAVNDSKTGTFTVLQKEAFRSSSSVQNSSSSAEGTAPLFAAQKKLSSLQISPSNSGGIHLHFTASQSGTIHATLFSLTGVPLQSEKISATAGENSLTVANEKFHAGLYILNLRGAGWNISRPVELR